MKPILVIMAFTFVISFIQVSNAEPTLNECLGIGSTAKPTDEDIRACKTAGEAHWLYPQDRAKSYVMLARLFFMRRDFNRAKAAAVSALQQDRRNILAHYFIAHASYILGNYRDAEASSKDAIDLWPKYARAYFVRAWSLLALARYQEAIGDGLKLIKIEPKNGAAYSLVSLGLIAVGQNESSQKYAAKAIELAPKLAQGHMYLAAAQALSGQDDLAQVSIKKAQQLQGSLAEVWAITGLIHNVGGRFKESISAFDRAHKLQPSILGMNQPAYYQVFRVAKEASLNRLRVQASVSGGVEAVVIEAEDGKAASRSASESSDASTQRPEFSEQLLALKFKKVEERSDDVAVIIGNADYSRLGRDIPNVIPAYADAVSFQKYVTDGLGVKEGNVIFLRDATRSQLIRVFGSETNSRGQLFDWVRPARSNVTVYYSGHGAPDPITGKTYLVPADADSSRLSLTGFALELLYKNLGQLPAKTVTVVLESCFSGLSNSGPVGAGMSGISVEPKAPNLPSHITVVTAGASNQVASWEKDGSNGLFTKYLLIGLSGEADVKPYGDGNGTVDWQEMASYLQDTLTYMSRRYYGRDQVAQFRISKN